MPTQRRGINLRTSNTILQLHYTGLHLQRNIGQYETSAVFKSTAWNSVHDVCTYIVDKVTMGNSLVEQICQSFILRSGQDSLRKVLEGVLVGEGVTLPYIAKWPQQCVIYCHRLGVTLPGLENTPTTSRFSLGGIKRGGHFIMIIINPPTKSVIVVDEAEYGDGSHFSLAPKLCHCNFESHNDFIVICFSFKVQPKLSDDAKCLWTSYRICVFHLNTIQNR